MSEWGREAGGLGSAAPVSSTPVVVHWVDWGAGISGAGQLWGQKATLGPCPPDLGSVLRSAPELCHVGGLAAAF